MNRPIASVVGRKKKVPLTYFFVNVLDEEKSLTEIDESAIDKVTEYIDEHYTKHVCQKELEKVALMSGTNLKEKFKVRKHMNITEYIQRKRINEAEKRLHTTDESIQEIANSVGYQSHSHFAKIYKRYKGKSPSEDRKIHRNQ